MNKATNAGMIHKYALDIPSGLHPDIGRCLGSAFSADFTFCFGGIKPGYFLEDGPTFCGQIIRCELPIPSSYKEAHQFVPQKGFRIGHNMILLFLIGQDLVTYLVELWQQ